MTKWIVLTVGLLLLLSGICYFLYNPVRLNETAVAFQNLAEIPALQLRQEHTATVTVIVPDDHVWHRIRRSWGEPDYDVALISSQHELQYCFDGINVRATEGNRQLDLQSGWGIYGFGSDESYPQHCQSAGQMFHAAPGSIVNVILTSEQFGRGEMIVVRPVWYDTKDKLVGVYLDEDLRSIFKSMFIVGLGTTSLAGFMIVRDGHVRNRLASQKNVIA